jgi:demethylsterigmatocystin 6-O-methyltransferase
LEAFPLKEELVHGNAGPEKAVFVDVGGGFGHQCMKVVETLKSEGLDGKVRVILQDLPETVELLKAKRGIEGVEIMMQDFFEPQIIKGMAFLLSVLPCFSSPV